MKEDQIKIRLETLIKNFPGLLEIIAKLNKGLVDWVISDGMALVLYGVDLKEDDVDIMIRDEYKDVVEKVCEKSFVENTFSEGTLKGSSNTLELGYIEIYYALQFIDGEKVYDLSLSEKVYHRMTNVFYENLSINIISLEDIIVKKLISQREKDIFHVNKIFHNNKMEIDVAYICSRVEELKAKDRCSIFQSILKM